MIKLENVEVYGWKAAIRGMRNPMNSWDKSDSFEYNEPGMWLGSNDLKLMKRLAKAGSDHRKFLRMITVTVDVTAPLYFLKECDQYKVGVTSNSCSTMHKIHAKEFTMDDFSHEHLFGWNIPGSFSPCDDCVPIKEGDGMERTWASGDVLETVIAALNFYRERFLETNDKKYWWQLIQLLPSSYNQRRTYCLNYEVLANIYFARRNHKLDCWKDFCKWIETLPYAKELICSVD